MEVTEMNKGIGAVACDLGSELKLAFDSLFSLSSDYFKAQEDVTIARVMLAEGEEAILRSYASNPKELGPNEETRKATIKGMLSAQANKVDVLERAEQQGRHAVALAQITVDGLKAQLRCLEVIAALSVNQTLSVNPSNVKRMED